MNPLASLHDYFKKTLSHKVGGGEYELSHLADQHWTTLFYRDGIMNFPSRFSHPSDYFHPKFPRNKQPISNSKKQEMPDISLSASKKKNPLASVNEYLKKSLLPKVEKGENGLSQLPYKHCTFFDREGLMNSSPFGFFAPTPVAASLVMKFSCKKDSSDDSVSETPSGAQESFDVPQAKIPKGWVIHPSLLRNLPGSKVDQVLKNQERSDCQEKINEGFYGYIIACDNLQGGEKDDGGVVGELCNGLSKISMKDKRMAEFLGKGTSFIYISNKEIEKEKGKEEDNDGNHSDDDDDREHVGLAGILDKGLCMKGLEKKKKTKFVGKQTRFIYNSDGVFEGEEIVTKSSVLPANGFQEKHKRLEKM